MKNLDAEPLNDEKLPRLTKSGQINNLMEQLRGC